MSLVDHEAVLAALKAAIRAKPSFGRRELTDLLCDLEVLHRKDESVPERALRVYLPELLEQLGDKD